VHKVERLIHLELAERRAQKDMCEQCGREHREWFEVEASKPGLKGVDEVVRRWVGWAERADHGHTTGRHEGSMGGREVENARLKGRDEERSVSVPLATAVDGYY
jgi:T5orf172 domain